jgi:hypothetical protein
MRAPETARLALLALLAALATSTPARDSTAEPDAGAARVVIPPWVEDQKLPAFDEEPFPAEKTKPPRPEEWKAAPPVRPTHVSKGLRACQAMRVREWVKIHCNLQTAGLRLVAGSPEGIALWVPEPPPDASPFVMTGQWSEIVFPVRPGDRRLFELLEVVWGYETPDVSSLLLVEEQWRAGAAKPEIALLLR